MCWGWSTFHKLKVLRLIPIITSLSLLISTSPAFSVEVSSGAKCKELGQMRSSGSKLFTCVKSGKQFVWNKGTDLVEADLIFNGTKMSFGTGINYSVLATRGDRCVVTLYIDSRIQDSQSFIIGKSSNLNASFWTSPRGSTQMDLSCKFSGSDLEFVPVSLTPTPTPSARVTPTPTPSTRVTPTPTPSTSNPFSDAATAAAKEAAEKKRLEEEKLRLAEDEREKQRQKSISQALARLLEAYCGRRTNCDIGKAGPGGGLVFFHAQQPQWWGTHLEVRTTNVVTSWCDKPTLALTKNVTDSTIRRTLGKEIGKGKQNTLMMLAACSSGAANVASAFRGGGLDDWYLPSHKELDQICKFAAGINIEEINICHRSENSVNIWNYFPSIGEYWSSSEYTENLSPEGNFAWSVQFFDGRTGPLDKKATRPILAVRAYGPKSD